MITTRPAKPCDAILIGLNLRAADKLEVFRMAQGDAVSVLRRTIETSDIAVVFEKDGVPLGAAGICSTLDIGHPWLVGTHTLSKNPKSFLKKTRVWLEETRPNYLILNNFVDASYTGALRWLEWLGFTIHPPEMMGASRSLFCRVEIRG